MLYVRSDSDEQELHIPGDNIWINARDIIEVQADGDELEVIKEQFGTSIPTGNARVQRWFGDIAKSVVANLRF